MKKYVMNKVSEADHVVFTFGDDGRLQGVEFCGLEDPQRAAILTKCPLNESEMEWWKKNTWIEVTVLEGPAEFSDFWDKYAYKVGNMKRARKLWGLLAEDERRAAITGIRRYNSYLAQHPSIEKAYPETYLSQKRWEGYK